MLNKFKALASDNSGATAIEYGLLATLIAMAIVPALRGLGTAESQLFVDISEELDGLTPAAGGDGDGNPTDCEFGEPGCSGSPL